MPILTHPHFILLSFLFFTLLETTGTTATEASAAEATATGTTAAEATATTRTTTSEATRTATTCRHASRHHTRHHAGHHALPCLLASKSIETVDDMHHCIAVDCVILRITSHHVIDGARQTALLVKDVIQLQTYCECLALQEAVTNLCIPNQLVGVH